MGFFLIFLVAVVLGAAIIWFSYEAARKRREAFRHAAHSMGLEFRPDKDFAYDERYPFLAKLCQGDDRYSFNVIAGTWRKYAVEAFDYHYETTSTDSDGDRHTHDHYFSFFILHLDRNFPELMIFREGWLSKIAQFFGFDDIDFESAEFSRTFAVRCRDKKFAYDICHGLMIEYLLANSDLSVEIDRHCLTLFFPQRLAPDGIRYNLDRLVTIREMFPGYLFDTAT